jgi:quinol monooxygenase YgiN
VARFIQIIEFTTSRPEEIRSLVDRLRDEGDGLGGVVRSTLTEDRDRPGHYLNIVEFDSYDEAMANSNRPEVSAFAARMAELCDGPPRFYNLDVTESWSTQHASASTKAAVVGAVAAVAGAAATGVTKARQTLQERRHHPPSSEPSSSEPSSSESTGTTRAAPPPVVQDGPDPTVGRNDSDGPVGSDPRPPESPPMS